MVSPTCAATPVPSVRVVTFSSVGSSAGMETTGLGGTLPVGVVEAMVVVAAKVGGDGRSSRGCCK